jgi:hypothetical protein
MRIVMLSTSSLILLINVERSLLPHDQLEAIINSVIINR